ncbi:MAG: Holliday junction resolvase RuvX [Deltaproteobacteria bacterium]
MRILALDVGTKTIGVAVSDELLIAAHGVTTIKRLDLKRDIEALRKLIGEYKPARIIVGIPYRHDGSVGARGEEIIKFSDKIKGAFGIPVLPWDESFTTKRAESLLLEADLSRKKRKKVIDKIAAAFILEGYIETIRQDLGLRPNSSEEG